MKILFVNPRFPQSLWGMQGMADLVGVRSGQAPLALMTVAALTPPDIDVELVDENCYPVPLDTDADVVAIGCWNVQYARAFELGREFRRRGKHVVVGGPYVSLCPERFVDSPFHTVFEGETEITWPIFCRDLLAGTPQPAYRQAGNVDIALSPVPRFDLIRNDDYVHYFVQTTRGCPFQCEFCDIIVTDGRIPRTKPVAQVLAEIERIAALGGRYIGFSDANFIGNMRYAEQLLHALVDFGRARGFPVSFTGEMTVNVAERPQLLALLREANFTGIFVGIESPRIESLVESKKRQNVHKPLIESLRRIQSHNLVVTAGMIVGFDHDDVHIFQEQFDFLQDAGIPFTTCGVLTAIEKTPLHARMHREGRLLEYDSASVLGHGAADLNFVPKLMSVNEVHEGYNWLIRSLYRYDNYGKRLVTGLRQFGARPGGGGKSGGGLDIKMLLILANLVRYFLLTRDDTRRRFFLRTIWAAMQGPPSLEKVVSAISYMVAHKHFHEYVTATHGDPETVLPLSPFAERERLVEWWQADASREFSRRLWRGLYTGSTWRAWLGRRRRHRAVAIPDLLLSDRIGQCLRRYLNELGVEVVPVAAAGLSRLREQADLLVLPILGTVRKGREELHQRIQQLNERVQADLERLPRIVHVSLDGDRAAHFDGFAGIGLTFTRRLRRLRRAYRLAIEAVAAPGGQPALH
jgi:radical SAM superfamily enzyme YgiQ (UPF0313 family)